VTPVRMDAEVLTRDPWKVETGLPVHRSKQVREESRAGAIGGARAGRPRGDADLTDSFGFDTGDVVERAP